MFTDTVFTDEEKIKRLFAWLEIAKARITELEQAAKPFADFLPFYPASSPDNMDTNLQTKNGHWITVGEIRRLAAALDK